MVAFTAIQGQRVHAPFFLDQVLEYGTEGCNDPLAVDVDMSTFDGHATSSPSTTLEAMEDPSAPWRLAVQWHPENDPDPRLFAAFVTACRGG